MKIEPMNKKIFLTATLLGLIGIILGAFAAHGLKPRLSAESMATFETGVQYQMYAAFFLFALGLLPHIAEKTKNLCFYLTIIGIILFSGSIYLLSTNALTSFDFRVIGVITPIGGSLMIAAWAVLFLEIMKLKIK